jgi:hypothetical protein
MPRSTAQYSKGLFIIAGRPSLLLSFGHVHPLVRGGPVVWLHPQGKGETRMVDVFGNLIALARLVPPMVWGIVALWCLAALALVALNTDDPGGPDDETWW